MKNLLLRINDRIYMSCIWVAGLAVLGVALIIPWGIFARYVLGTGTRLAATTEPIPKNAPWHSAVTTRANISTL